MYVTVCDPCLDEDHASCDEANPDSALQVERDEVRRRGACGGGMCICAVCGHTNNLVWYEQVKNQALAHRARID